MIATWLSSTRRTDAGRTFEVFDVREQRVDRNRLVSAIAAELSAAHINPEFVSFVAERVGATAAKKILSERTFPNAVNVRHGNFGEILATVLLRDRDHLTVPILKLRFRDKREWSMRLTDIVAFDQPSACEFRAAWFVEVKTRTTKDLRAAIVGHESLRKECEADRPEILSFISGRLFDLRRLEECAAIEALMASEDRLPRQHLITLVFDTAEWDERILEKLVDLPPTLDPLQVDIVLVDQLADLINDCYTCAKVGRDGGS